jgi:hypothetical protein
VGPAMRRQTGPCGVAGRPDLISDCP